MALKSTQATSASSPDKSIALNATSNLTLYTVPNGRKFEGFLNTAHNTHTGIFSINNVIVTSGPYNSYVPISLLGGDVVKTVSYSGSIFGIESDA